MQKHTRLWLGGLALVVVVVFVILYGQTSLQKGAFMRLSKNLRPVAKQQPVPLNDKTNNPCGIASTNAIAVNTIRSTANPSNNEAASVCYFVQKDLPRGFTVSIHGNANAIVKILYVKNNFTPKGTTNSILWDGKDDNGSILPDGNYYYKFFIDGNITAGGMISVENKGKKQDVILNPLNLPTPFTPCDQLKDQSSCTNRSECNWINTNEFQRCEDKLPFLKNPPLTPTPPPPPPPPPKESNPIVPPITHVPYTPPTTTTVPSCDFSEWSSVLAGSYFYYPPPTSDYAVFSGVSVSNLSRLASYLRAGCSMRIKLENGQNPANNTTLTCNSSNMEVAGGNVDPYISCTSGAAFAGGEFDETRYGTFQYDKLAFGVRAVNGVNTAVIMKNRYGSAPAASTVRTPGELIITSFFDPTNWDARIFWNVEVSVQK